MIYICTLLGIMIDIVLLGVIAQVLCPRCAKPILWTVYSAYGLLVFVLNMSELPALIRIPFYASIIWLIFTVCYKPTERGIKAGLVALYMVVLSIPELLIITSVMLFGSALNRVEDFVTNPTLWLYCLLIAKTSTYIIFSFLRRMYRDYKNARKRFLGFVQYGPLVITWVLIIVMVCMLINVEEISKEDAVFTIGAVTVIVFAYTLAHNVYVQIYYELKEKEYENRILKEKSELQCRYYTDKLYLESEMQKICHDLKNYQLILHKRNVNASELDNRLSYLAKHFAPYTDTGNEMLNILLSEKIHTAEQCNLKLEIAVAVPGWFCLTDMEICVVFGNLIDNALEAASSIELVDKRKITIKACATGEDSMAVKIKNSYLQPVKRRRGKFLSTKPNSERRGIGLNNVQEIVEKCGGCMDIQTSNNIFEVSILFFKDSIQNKNIN